MILKITVLVGVVIAVMTAILCPFSIKEDGAKLCSDFIHQRRLMYDRTHASKTGYRFIGNISNETYYDGCTAKKIYMLIRHGSRMPKKSQILHFNGLHDKIQKTIGNSGLKAWHNPFPLEEQTELTAPGMKELYCLAGRMSKRFPNLFKPNYSSMYSFQSTFKTRAITSALSFAEYLFQNTGPLNGYQPIPLSVNSEDDPILRFFDCSLYAKMVDKNETLSEFLNQFLSSHHFKDVQKRLQNLIDPDEKVWTITYKDILSMYLICTMETANFKESVWCKIFSQTDLDILEYYNDLKNYWTKGYGFPININISCLLFDDMITSLNSDKASTFLRFAHAETLVPVITALGLFKDKEPLSSLDYNGDREFRTADIAPFAGNVAFVVYQCGQKHFVRILVNEQDVVLQHTLCNYGSKKNLCLLDELQKIITATSDNAVKFPCHFCVE